MTHLIAFCFLCAAQAAGITADADVIRVIDGDTLEVSARIWPQQSVRTTIRIRGIDAAELPGRCQAETILAEKARARLAELAGAKVTLGEVGNDKYGGRYVATVADSDGRDLGLVLIAEGLARAYDGGQRQGWCGL
jgi:endonuclease YncB( thermonuclease family)